MRLFAKKLLAVCVAGAMLTGTFSSGSVKADGKPEGIPDDGETFIYDGYYYDTSYSVKQEDRKAGETDITVTDPVLIQDEKVVLDSVNKRKEDRIHYIKLNGDPSQSSDAILIESNGHYGLIDASNRAGDMQYGIPIVNSASGKTVVEYLESVGVDHLDFIMATHSHSDHIGGVPEIAASVIAMEKKETSSVYKVDKVFTDENGKKVDIKDIDEDKKVEPSGEETDEISLDPNDYEDIVETEEDQLPMVDESTVYIYKNFTQNSVEADWKNDWYYDQALSAMEDCPRIVVNNPSQGGLQVLGATMSANGSSDKDDTISFKFGDFNISLYNLYSQSKTDENANSIITYIEKGDTKTVLLADIDVNEKLEQQFADAIVSQHGKITVMKVGHHGYTKSTSKELIDILGAKYAVIQTCNTTLKDYSPFYAYMKMRDMELYRTLDQAGDSIIQDMTSSLIIKQGNVTESEPYEVYKRSAVYEVKKSYKQNYERYEMTTPVYTQGEAVPEEVIPDPEAGGSTPGEGGSGEGGDPINPDPEYTEYTEMPSAEPWEEVINTWVENITQKSKLTKDTIIYRNRVLSLGDAAVPWVQTSGIDNWAMWFNDWDDYYWVYVNKDGSFKKGWHEINGETYYFDDEGIMQTGWVKKDGKKVYLLEADYGTRKLGAMMTGWYTDDKVTNYFDADGALHTGWLNVDGSTYYFDSEGKMYSGGTKKIDGKTYIFKENGARVAARSWAKVGKDWYYTNEDGSGYSGWMLSGAEWYYMDENGKMKTGWVKDGSQWYYMYSSGVMAVGWINDGQYWYYMTSSGSMASSEWVDGYWLGGGGAWTYQAKGSWHKDGKGWYFQDEWGWYVSGSWQKINDEWYYFKNSGYLATNQSIDGCYVNEDGQWVK